MCTKEHLFLKAAFTLNREAKKLEKQNNEKSKKHQELLYNLKKYAIYYIIYYFKTEILAHSYKTGSYWLILVAGFKFHHHFIQIPVSKNKKKDIKYIDFNKIKNMEVFEAIQIINNSLNDKNSDDGFQEFLRKFKLYDRNKVRPKIGNCKFY